MQTICAELELGERLLTETVERYGAGAVHGAMDYVCDAVGRAHRAGARGDFPTASGRARTRSTATASTTRRSTGSTSGSSSAAAAPRSTSAARRARRARASTRTALDVEDDRRHRASSTCSTRAGRSRRARPAASTSSSPRARCVSALPPDGAVFAYWEQSQVDASRRFCARSRRRSGAAAMAGDRGSADIHNANGLLPDGTPWVSVAQCGGEVGPFGANRHGDADSQMLSYQANGIGAAVGGDRVRRPGRRAPPRDRRPTRRARATTGAAPRWSATRCGCSPPSTTSCRCATSAPRGFGVHGRRRRDAREGSGSGSLPRAASTALTSTGPDAYRDGDPGGRGARSRRRTARPRRRVRVLRTACPRGTRAPMARLRYVTNGGGGCGDPLRARARAR